MIDALAAGVLVLALVAALADQFVDNDSESRHWSEEEAKRAYVEGEIGIDEFERWVRRCVDDRAHEIRERVEGVSHVGPHRAARLADRFETVEDLREADREDLEDVHGVGPSIADRIRERV